MQGVERSHCNATIGIILSAAKDLWNATVEEALRPVHGYGKGDTLGMDAMPEIIIAKGLLDYDASCVVITEEVGWKGNAHFVRSDNPRSVPTIFISDPTDRSSQLKAFLQGIIDKSLPVHQVIGHGQCRTAWENELDFGKPITITGSTSSITCVRRGVPIFTVTVNYLTRQLLVSCSAGNFILDLPSDQVLPKVNLDYVQRHGRKIFFRTISSARDMRRFVTFMGKSGYRENFLDSRLIEESQLDTMLAYSLPGGPTRPLYLSNLQPKSMPIGFVLANGEKIGEWIHWLPWVRFARNEHDQSEPALRLFEVFQDRPWTKEGILMATPPAYSIFKPAKEKPSHMVIDVGQIPSFANPSHIRSTLIVAPADNAWANRVVNQYGYREIHLYSEDQV